MSYRLDEIDKRIIYHLGRDARNTSAPMIAEEVDVSPGTIRNRIRQMEEAGVIRGYHADVDFEECDRRLATLFTCTTPKPFKRTLANQVLEIPGVVNVRHMRTGHGNLKVKAVGTDTNDLRRIGDALVSLDLEIESENLIQDEYFHPYHPFGPNDGTQFSSMTDFLSLTGGAEVVEIRVDGTAPIAGKTLAEANDEGLLDDEVLVIAVEREDAVITPRGRTPIEPGDLVTVFSRHGVSDELVAVFATEQEAD